MLESKLSIAVPHYRIGLPSGEYVVDAYFMKEVAYPPRRALLIYPTTVVSGSASEAAANVLLESKLTARDVYDVLRSTYEELQVRLSRDIRRILHRSRLSILIPMPRAALGEIDSETRSALIILDKVFSGSKLRAEADLLRWNKVHVVVDIRKTQDGTIAVDAPRPIPKIYEWLYRVDVGFRYVLDKVVEGSSQHI